MDPTKPVARTALLRGGILRWTDAAGHETVAEIREQPLILGRDPEAGLRIDDARVSRFHAQLEATADGVRVRDLGSVNGVWVGDVRIQQALLVGTTNLRLGPVAVTFEAVTPAKIELVPGTSFGPMFGGTTTMRHLFSRLARVARSDIGVLILGETGTGKELVARAIHEHSSRAAGPFVVVDCAAIAPSLAEATLFGHERGAFTGAGTARESPFTRASGGTLFLDELGELPLEVQTKLLRALAEQKVQPLGAASYRTFDARIVAATRRDLSQAVADLSFRSDLYFRVAQFVLSLPPLRERREDIPGLVQTFIAAAARDPAPHVPMSSMASLLSHDWPGNIRELRNAVEVALALSDPGADLHVDEFIAASRTTAISQAPPPDFGLENYHHARKQAMETFERAFFERLLSSAKGNLSEMGRRAGMSRNHVRRHLVDKGLLPKKGAASGGH